MYSEYIVGVHISQPLRLIYEWYMYGPHTSSHGPHTSPHGLNSSPHGPHTSPHGPHTSPHGRLNAQLFCLGICL